MKIRLIIDDEEKIFKAKVDEEGFLHLISDEMTITIDGIDTLEKLLNFYKKA